MNHEEFIDFQKKIKIYLLIKKSNKIESDLIFILKKQNKKK